MAALAELHPLAAQQVSEWSGYSNDGFAEVMTDRSWPVG